MTISNEGDKICNLQNVFDVTLEEETRYTAEMVSNIEIIALYLKKKLKIEGLEGEQIAEDILKLLGLSSL